MGKKLFKVSPSTVMNWIKKAGADVKAPEIIEQDNSNTMHYLGRMTRRTKVYFQVRGEEMLNISMKLLCAQQCEQVFDNFQKIFFYL